MRTATRNTAQLCWTLGITEHHNAVDNVFALINLSLLTGQVGRYGSGVQPLRGQNNVQGGGDMGAIPNRLPGFQDVEDAAVRAKFDAAWGATIPPKQGCTSRGCSRRWRTASCGRCTSSARTPHNRRPTRHAPKSSCVGSTPRRAGPLPDEDGPARGRRLAGRRMSRRVGGNGHLERTARAARAQGIRPARRGP